MVNELRNSTLFVLSTHFITLRDFVEYFGTIRFLVVFKSNNRIGYQQIFFDTNRRV